MCDNLIELLRCPNCGVDLSGELNCQGCGKNYSKTERGVYDLVIDEEKLEEQEMTNKLVDLIKEKGLQELQKRQQEKMTGEMKKAKQKMAMKIGEELNALDGRILEIASGPGGASNQLIKEEATTIITDINLDILQIKSEKVMQGRLNEDYYMIACDAKNIPIKNGIIDHVVSLGGLVNIPNPSNVIDEIYRVLKEGGKLLATPIFVEEDSKGAEKAREMKVEDGVLKENLKDVLSNSDFDDHDIEMISSAEGVEDDLNILQTEGEMMYYSVLTAEK